MKIIGKVCAKHPEIQGERYASRSTCVGCSTARNARKYAENADKIKASSKAYRAGNADNIKAYKAKYYVGNASELSQHQRAYYIENSDTIKKRQVKYRAGRKRDPAWRKANRAQSREWDKNNRGKANAKAARRKATKLQATPTWANDFFISEAYSLAKLREKIVGGKWHVDHVIPLKSKFVCGLHVEHNLCVIQASANQSKGNRLWPDMPG